jgi:hypothetical protein
LISSWWTGGNKSPLNKSNYDKAKRSTNYHVRQAIYEYERSIATNMKEDNKIFWKFIQSKTKSKENIPCIMDEKGELQMDYKIKAELLNKFFQSVFRDRTFNLKGRVMVFCFVHKHFFGRF